MGCRRRGTRLEVAAVMAPLAAAIGDDGSEYGTIAPHAWREDSASSQTSICTKLPDKQVMGGSSAMLAPLSLERPYAISRYTTSHVRKKHSGG